MIIVVAVATESNASVVAVITLGLSVVVASTHFCCASVTSPATEYVTFISCGNAV